LFLLFQIKKEPPDEDRKFGLSPQEKPKIASSPELDGSTTDTDVEMRYLTEPLVYAPFEEDTAAKPKPRRRQKKPVSCRLSVSHQVFENLTPRLAYQDVLEKGIAIVTINRRFH
jgi:hypothetical protein